MKISCIIVYTNQELYEQCVKFLNQQTNVEVEIISIDNKDNKFTSSSSALNYGAKLSSGEILVFMHQDIVVHRQETLAELGKSILTYEGNNIFGVAGVVRENSEIISNISQEYPHKEEFVPLVAPIEVESCDECLFAMTREVYDKYNFDEQLCDNWHLYAVELCYRIRRDGGKAICLPVELCHLSHGNANKNFYKGVKKLIKVYKHDFDQIHTTCIYTRMSYLHLKYIVFMNLTVLPIVRKIRARKKKKEKEIL